MAVKRVVDLVFLVDVTGSMSPCIEGLKASIKQFFAHLTDESANACAIRDWRAKVVGYRDAAFDAEQWLVDQPFVRTSEEIHAQLDALVAKGGGDEPESLLDALLTVADMGEMGLQDREDPAKWRARGMAARVVVVFTDATYHPEATVEKYAGCGYQDVARKLGEQRVILEVITPVSPADKSVPQETFEQAYEALASADKAEYCPLRTEDGVAFPFSEIGAHMELFEQFVAQLAKTLSATVAPPEL